MIRIHRLWLLPIAFALAFAAAPPPVSLAVSPRVAHGPRDVRLAAKVEPHTDNRLLAFVIDGPRYARQDIELNTTDNEWRTFARVFRAVPAGDYVATAMLRRAGDKSFRSIGSFCLTGPNVSCAAGTAGEPRALFGMMGRANDPFEHIVRMTGQEPDVFTVTDLVSSADHEIAEGIFTLGPDLTITARPGSAAYQWLGRHRAHRAVLTLGPERPRELQTVRRGRP